MDKQCPDHYEEEIEEGNLKVPSASIPILARVSMTQLRAHASVIPPEVPGTVYLLRPDQPGTWAWAGIIVNADATVGGVLQSLQTARRNIIGLEQDVGVAVWQRAFVDYSHLNSNGLEILI
jgi:hypothetical protein